MGKISAPLLCLGLVAVSGCAGPKNDLPVGTAAYNRIPPATPEAPRADYVIGPLDKLGVTVFGERDLSTDQAQVDAAGHLSLPLVGQLVAAGKTSSGLSQEIQQRLSRYIVNPRVSILVLSSVSQRVIIEGSVNQAGVYQLQGPTTLLEVIAEAKGTSSVANDHRVAVFRTINGQRMGAMFDLTEIETGGQPDPEMRSGDVVIVGSSPGKGLIHDFLVAAPALGFFVVLADRL